jgi:hypothetical protein
MRKRRMNSSVARVSIDRIVDVRRCYSVSGDDRVIKFTGRSANRDVQARGVTAPEGRNGLRQEGHRPRRRPCHLLPVTG